MTAAQECAAVFYLIIGKYFFLTHRHLQKSDLLPLGCKILSFPPQILSQLEDLLSHRVHLLSKFRKKAKPMHKTSALPSNFKIKASQFPDRRLSPIVFRDCCLRISRGTLQVSGRSLR